MVKSVRIKTLLTAQPETHILESRDRFDITMTHSMRIRCQVDRKEHEEQVGLGN